MRNKYRVFVSGVGLGVLATFFGVVPQSRAAQDADLGYRLQGLPQCTQGGPCQELQVGDRLVSPQSRYSLTLEPNGSLVLERVDLGVQIWHSPAAPPNTTPSVAVMQWDGNFVLYDTAGQAYWSTNTWTSPGASVQLQDDGDLVVCLDATATTSCSNSVWESHPASELIGNSQCGKGGPCQELNPGDGLVVMAGGGASPGDTYSLVLQPNGSLVLYSYDTVQVVWYTPAAPTGQAGVAVMQWDGNFVLYDNVGQPYWSTNTWTSPGSNLQLQNDGNIVVYQGGTAVWASNTNACEMKRSCHFTWPNCDCDHVVCYQNYFGGSC